MKGIQQIKYKCYLSLLAGLLMAEALWGCEGTDQARTILLPPAENTEKDGTQIEVSRIHEYSCEDSLDSLMFPALGAPGGSLLYLLKRQKDGSLLCTTVDMEQNAVLADTFVDFSGAEAVDVHFAPGGKYFSYERTTDGGSQLVLFSMKYQDFVVLCDIDRHLEAYNYAWSDDGTCLFSWQAGDAYNPYMDWQVTRYQISDGSDGRPEVNRIQFEMEGSGYAVRSVLPNADGSEAYVREEFNPYLSDVEREKLGLDKNTYATAGGSASTANDADTDGALLPAKNWLIHLEGGTMASVEEYATGPAWPIKYTTAGLFVREDDGTLCLIEEVGGQQKRTELFQAEGMDVCVCEKGDHLFLAEWINASTYQISGARVLDGEASGRRILYRSTFDTIDHIWVEGDEAVMFYSLKFLEFDKESQYNLRIVSLEY